MNVVVGPITIAGSLTYNPPIRTGQSVQIPTSTLITAGSVIPAGNAIPKYTTISAGNTIKGGLLLPPGTIFTRDQVKKVVVDKDINFTGVNKRETVDITITKIWVDDNPDDRPTDWTVKYTVIADGTPLDFSRVSFSYTISGGRVGRRDKGITVDTKTSSSATIYGLPRYEHVGDVSEITYTIAEDPIAGYDAIITYSHEKPPYPDELKVEVKNIPHKPVKIDAVAASCETDGNIEHWHCSACDKYYPDAAGTTEITKADTVITQLGHDWGDWVVTKAATETAEGEETRTCKRDASHTETRSIPKKTAQEYKITFDPNGGNWSGSSSPRVITYKAGETITIAEAPTRDGYTFLYWKGSEYQPGDSYIVTENHTFKAIWKEKNNPSSGTDGNTNTGANTGGNTNTGSNTGGNTNTGSNAGVSSPKTGDNSNMLLWFAIMCVSLFALFNVISYRRRHNK